MCWVLYCTLRLPTCGAGRTNRVRETGSKEEVSFSTPGFCFLKFILKMAYIWLLSLSQTKKQFVRYLHYHFFEQTFWWKKAFSSIALGQARHMRRDWDWPWSQVICPQVSSLCALATSEGSGFYPTSQNFQSWRGSKRWFRLNSHLQKMRP